MKWYVPSFYGDIRLERLPQTDTKAKEVTMVTWSKLTALEKGAIIRLGDIVVDKSMTSSPFDSDLFGKDEGRIELTASVTRIQKILSRALKPGRKIVDVVMFESGKMVETTTADVEEVVKKESSKAVAGASVGKPTLGCPMPDLVKADLRATEVLFAFLDDQQRDDFQLNNAFITQGAATGHRYMVTSRHATDRLSHYRRQLYDLDEKRPYCVHDYDVPAAEEMLALHLLLQIPNHEYFLRHLEHMDTHRS